MGTIIHQPAAQMMAGHAVGILLLNTGYPIIPGNVANASTYNYPVRFKVVEGADSPRLIGGDPTLLEPILAAARELVRDGCRAIVGACGYFARFQRELAEALPVPVFLSSLCQVPMVLGALQPQQQLGILCAKQSSLDQQMLTAVGIREDAPIVVAGMENSPGFRGAILEDQGWMDLDQVQRRGRQRRRAAGEQTTPRSAPCCSNAVTCPRTPSRSRMRPACRCGTTSRSSTGFTRASSVARTTASSSSETDPVNPFRRRDALDTLCEQARRGHRMTINDDDITLEPGAEGEGTADGGANPKGHDGGADGSAAEGEGVADGGANPGGHDGGADGSAAAGEGTADGGANPGGHDGGADGSA